jgi:hypothetical protein
MRKYLVPGLGLLLIAAIGWAVLSATDRAPGEAKLRLVDTGWLSDSKTGEGVYMTFEADALPPGGIKDFGESIASICNQFVGTAIPFVSEKTGKQNPQSVVITIKHGGIVGT